MPVYWYGKNKAASLFGTGPVFGGSATQMLAWFYAGGGEELYRELTQDIMGLNVYGFYGFPMPAQPLRLVQGAGDDGRRPEGFKYRTVGLAADMLQRMGLSVAQLPGGEIVPAMERGVIDAFEFNNPTSDSRFGAQDVAKHYFLSSYHQAAEFFEILFNKDFFDDLPEDLQAILRVRRRGDQHGQHGDRAGHLLGRPAEADQRGRRQRAPHLQDIMEAQLKAWDEVIPSWKRTRSSPRSSTASGVGRSGSCSTS